MQTKGRGVRGALGKMLAEHDIDKIQTHHAM